MKSAPRLGGGDQKPPIWNYKNLAGRKAIPNSQKDPFYNERAKFIEERRQKRLEYYQNLAKKNSEKFEDYMQKQQKGQRTNDDDFSNDGSMSRNDQTASRRQSTASSMSFASNQTYSNNSTSNHNTNSNNIGASKTQQESIFNLLGKNLAANTIYEEEEETHPNQHRQTNQKHQINNYNQSSNEAINTVRSQAQSQHHFNQPQLKNVNSTSSLDDYLNNGFVPFMRTNEFLDPTHAGSPIPPSRESSAVKENREKARQVF